MTITRSHKSHVGSTTTGITQSWLTNNTRSVPDIGLTPGQRMLQHWEAIGSTPAGLGNSEIGNAFEAVIYDTFCHWGIKVVAVQMQLTKHNNAEVDLVVEGQDKDSTQWLVPVKTSLRERWAQFDRTFIIADALSKTKSLTTKYRKFALWYSEESVWVAMKKPVKKRRPAASDIAKSTLFEGYFFCDDGRMATIRHTVRIDMWFHDELLACPCGGIQSVCLADPKWQSAGTTGP